MNEQENPRGRETQNAEIQRLENLLVLAEHRYAKDISKLQQALLRTKRLGNLHMVGLHYRLYPLFQACKALPLEYAFYHWKSQSNSDRHFRVKKMQNLLKYVYKKTIMKKFIVFREKTARIPLQNILEGAVYAHGAMAPIMGPDEDELEL